MSATPFRWCVVSVLGGWVLSTAAESLPAGEPPARLYFELVRPEPEEIRCGPIIVVDVFLSHVQDGLCGFYFQVVVRDQDGEIVAPRWGVTGRSPNEPWEECGPPSDSFITELGTRIEIICEPCMFGFEMGCFFPASERTFLTRLSVDVPVDYEGAFSLSVEPEALDGGFRSPLFMFRDPDRPPPRCFDVDIEVEDSELFEVPCPRFIRGDSNDDGEADLSDAVHTLTWLFAGEGKIRCLHAADANDSGTLEITDAVYVLNYRFRGGPPPPPPFPKPGVDTAYEELECRGFQPP